MSTENTSSWTYDREKILIALLSDVVIMNV